MNKKSSEDIIKELVSKSRKAQSIFEKYNQQQVDEVITAVAWSLCKPINNKNGGIISVITNSRFIENPTFRGMRSRLMKDFDQIYLLNLNGSSSSRGENISPSGKIDENIFDINQSVCIRFFIQKFGVIDLKNISICRIQTLNKSNGKK